MRCWGLVFFPFRVSLWDYVVGKFFGMDSCRA